MYIYFRFWFSVVTITVDDNIFFECTYINGLGYENFHIFDKAVFFFSKSPLKTFQSYHRIDGKQFPMEIVFYFHNKQKKLDEGGVYDPAEILNTTQVSTLVEVYSTVVSARWS